MKKIKNGNWNKPTTEKVQILRLRDYEMIEKNSKLRLFSHNRTNKY